MKNAFLFFTFLLFVCCNNSQKNNSIKILNFPSWSDTITFINCDEIIAQTPPSFNFRIYDDSTINLNQFDNRLTLSFKFNWFYENYPDIGVYSIDILKDDGSISKIDLLGTGAFYEKTKNGFGDIVRDDITMLDVNMDSYLDIKFITDCGKSCFYHYWIYNKKTNDFEYSSSFAYTSPYCIDCKNQILYSYGGGEAYNFLKIAYKINGNELSIFQSSYFDSWNKDYDLQQYSDSAGNLISSDTIYK